MFNQPLSFDTSSVTDMKQMFWVRTIAPTSSRALACMPLEPRTALSSPDPHLDPALYAHLATRQAAEVFNQLLSLDTSSVTDMNTMFAVRTLAPTSS